MQRATTGIGSPRQEDVDVSLVFWEFKLTASWKRQQFQAASQNTIRADPGPPTAALERRMASQKLSENGLR